MTYICIVKALYPLTYRRIKCFYRPEYVTAFWSFENGYLMTTQQKLQKSKVVHKTTIFAKQNQLTDHEFQILYLGTAKHQHQLFYHADFFLQFSIMGYTIEATSKINDLRNKYQVKRAKTWCCQVK